MYCLKRMFIIIVMTVSLMTVIPINISNASTLDNIIVRMSKNIAPPNNTGTTRVKQIIKRVLGAIRLLTGLASVILIAYTGFKMAMGCTPEEKNAIKKALIPIITGVFIVFSATSIAVFIIGIFE